MYLQKIDFEVETTCNHTAASKDAIHGALKSFSREDVERMKDILAEAREKSKGPSDRVGWLAEETRLARISLSYALVLMHP